MLSNKTLRVFFTSLVASKRTSRPTPLLLRARNLGPSLSLQVARQRCWYTDVPGISIQGSRNFSQPAPDRVKGSFVRSVPPSARSFHDASRSLQHFVNTSANVPRKRFWIVIDVLSTIVIVILLQVVAGTIKNFWPPSILELISDAKKLDEDILRKCHAILEESPTAELGKEPHLKRSSVSIALGLCLYSRGKKAEAYETLKGAMTYLMFVEEQYGLGRDERNYGVAICIFLNQLHSELNLPVDKDVKDWCIWAVARGHPNAPLDVFAKKMRKDKLDGGYQTIEPGCSEIENRIRCAALPARERRPDFLRPVENFVLKYFMSITSGISTHVNEVAICEYTPLAILADIAYEEGDYLGAMHLADAARSIWKPPPEKPRNQKGFQGAMMTLLLSKAAWEYAVTTKADLPNRIQALRLGFSSINQCLLDLPAPNCDSIDCKTDEFSGLEIACLQTMNSYLPTTVTLDPRAKEVARRIARTHGMSTKYLDASERHALTSSTMDNPSSRETYESL